MEHLLLGDSAMGSVSQMLTGLKHKQTGLAPSIAVSLLSNLLLFHYRLNNQTKTTLTKKKKKKPLQKVPVVVF